MSDIANWMNQNKVLAFKAFSATDASDLPTGWTKPSIFSLDAVAVYDGKQMTLFTDEVHRMLIKDKKTKTMTLDDLATFPFSDKTLVGYGSSKFDLPLLKSCYPVFKTINHIDLARIVSNASEFHYGDYARRYDLRNLATTNRRKQTAMPHLSLMLKPIALLSEWQRGLARNVIRTLAAEVELIAELYSFVMIKEELTIIDERTDKPVTVNCSFVRDVLEEE